LSYAFSRSKKTATRCWYKRKAFLHGIQVVKAGLMASKSTLGIEGEVLALQDPEKMMVYHELHSLAQAISETDWSVTTCQSSLCQVLEQEIL
jgi:hypothetical protein